jgi:small multidrug resistance pump
MHFVYLGIAIVAEVIGTSALKASDSFTKLIPSLITVTGFVIAFYCLSLSLRVIPVGIAYAIWSALGIVLITLIGIFVFKQVPDIPAYIGLALIMAGVIVINLFSKMEVH